MATSPTVTNISPPPVISNFTDPNSGRLTQEGLRFLQLIWSRTGGSTGDTIYNNIVNIVGLGVDGSNFVFNDSTSTTSTSPTITITASLINMTGTASFVATAYDAAGTSLGTITLGGTGNVRTLTAAQFVSLGATTTRWVKIVATLGAQSDEVTIYRLDGGSDAYTMLLTNEAHTVPANNAGTVTSWSGANTIIKVYKGIADVTSSFAITKVDNSLTTAVTGSGTATPTVTASAMSADVGTADITATGAVTLTKTFTVTKAKQGAQGGMVFPVSNSGNIFRPNAAGTAASPSTMTLSRTLGSGVTDTLAAGTVWTVVAGTFTGSLAVANTSTGAIAAFGPSSMTTDTVTFRCTVTDTATAIVYYGDITLVKMRDPITATLTNDSINLPADSTGAVTAYTGATGTMIVSNASGPVTVTAGTNPTFAYLSSTGFTTAPTTSITTSGVYTISSGISAASTNATVTYRATYTDPLGGTTTVDKTFAIGKATIGATGSGARIAYALYAGGTTSPVGGSAVTKAGDPQVNTIYLPSTTSWTTTSATAWTIAPQTPAAGQALYRSNGLYDTTTNITTWQPPILDYYRVANLSAINADLGTCTAGTLATTGYITSAGATGLTVVVNGTSVTRNASIAGNTSKTQDVGVIGFASSSAGGYGIYGYSNNITLSSGGVYGEGYVGVIGVATQSAASGAVGVLGFCNANSSYNTSAGQFWSNGNTNSGTVVLKASADNVNQIAVETNGRLWLNGHGSNVEFRMKSATSGGVLNYGVIHDVSTTNYTIGVTAAGSAGSAASILPVDMDLATGEVRYQSAPASGGQVRLKVATGTSGYGVILRNDGTDFYILKTASGSANSIWDSTRPFSIQLSTGYLTLSNPSLRDMTTSTSQAGGAITPATNLPAGSAAATPVWIKQSINGVLYWIEAYPA